MKKENLLRALAETRQREVDLVAMCEDAPPDPSGRWRPQDHLAHLAFWRDREARLIDAVRAGGELPPDVSGEQENARVYETTREQSVAEVVAAARQSWDSLEAAVAACTDDDLDRPRPYARQPQKLGDGSPGDHVATHLFWCHIEAGDEKAAEAVLRWAQDLSSRTSNDPRTHAVGAYNLACYYARTGQAAEALPLLRESFEVAPDLKEWSHKDPDLDPIRGDARIEELLGAPAQAS
ncbi:MAG TPA: DinB family protein [Candidatus Dormibacteraeota bacterium]|nr:DinB family protein [Candidatus Dormibacteraeota bacterium]